MGIQYLSSFAKRCGGDVYTTFNIRAEIQKYQRENAIIIFDLNCFIYTMNKALDGVFGGRPQIKLEQINKFFRTLKDDGATLVFFCDGQLQDNKYQTWCKRSDKNYTNLERLLLPGTVTEKSLKANNVCNKNTTFLKSLIQMIKLKKIGEVIITREVECDRATVKYALDKKAMAVVSNDSDFLIFEGSFDLWEAESINFDSLMAQKLDREKLRNDILQLSSDQMKIFATIAGSDMTKPYAPKRIDHKGIARNIRIGHLQLSNEREIARYLDSSNECLRAIKKSLLFSDVRDVKFEGGNENVNVLKHAFETGAYFQYDANFFDYTIRNKETKETLIETFLQVFCKLGGLILRNDRSKKLRIVTKLRKEENYRLIERSPNFDFVHKSKWDKLLWSLGLDKVNNIAEDLDKVSEGEKNMVVALLAIMFLSKAKEIDERERMALFLTHYDQLIRRVTVADLIRMTIHSVSSRTIRTAAVYLKSFTLILDGFHVCDLNEELEKNELLYDAIYFDDLLRKFNEDKDFNRDKIFLEHMEGKANGHLQDVYQRLLFKYRLNT